VKVSEVTLLCNNEAFSQIEFKKENAQVMSASIASLRLRLGRTGVGSGFVRLISSSSLERDADLLSGGL